MLINYVRDLSTKIKCEDGGSYFYKNQKYRPLEIEKNILSINLFQKILIFLYACFQKTLNVSSEHSFKDSQNFFIQSLPLYTSCLFSMLLNDDIVDIEKPDGICSPTFDVDEFSGLFLHPSIFSIKHSRFA